MFVTVFVSAFKIILISVHMRLQNLTKNPFQTRPKLIRVGTILLRSKLTNPQSNKTLIARHRLQSYQAVNSPSQRFPAKQEPMTKLPLFSSLIFPIFLFAFLPFSVISQLPNPDARSTLLDLKRLLGNPPLLSWDAKSSPCDWPEITCSAGTVTGISLVNQNISVPIPSTICDLENLTDIDLSWNFIPGRFPIALYNCSKLQSLDLSQNYFVGPIPDDIHRLSGDLSYLNVGANNFSGDIPKSIGRLTKLKTLIMVQNEFSGTFPAEIGNLNELEYLAMAYNDKFKPSNIPLEFGNLKKLTYLWMTDTNLIGEIPAVVFSNLTALEHLDLALNDLTGRVPDGLFGLKNLTVVYLDRNKLEGELPKKISALNLREFDVSMNNLNGSIPEDLGKLSKLEILNLFGNKLTGEVPASIGLISTLKVFQVWKNQLTGELPAELGFRSKLEVFDAAENQFAGKLPENLCRGGVLVGVVAFSNNLSGEIPKSLENCNSLRVLQLYNNRFSGEIPLGIWNGFNISSLMVSNNLFTGKLPENIGWNLSRLEIEINRFSGEIPRRIGSWSNLIVFKASNNLFSGEIPTELTLLSNLNTLLLDQNQLSGALPMEIPAWKALTVLNLSRNKLSGEIPAVLGSLPSLLSLDLSENQFSGGIPARIGNLRLTSLNLSSNRLSGKIPVEFDNLAYQTSFLNNSDLCADNPVLRIPVCHRSTLRSSNGSHKNILLILVLSVLVLVITLLTSVFVVKCCKRRKCKSDLENWKLTSFHRLDFTDSDILSNLTENNLIGSGGFGKVYRIEINDSGESVAVKRIWTSKRLDQNLEKEFAAEVEILGTIRHSNIVKLLCCISSEDSKLLVYEYMEKRSLDKWLHCKDTTRTEEPVLNAVHRVVALDWPKRLQIAVGAAQGLCYMHHDCVPAIIHRDVKCSNILLDFKFNARIADFGLAKILNKDGDVHTMSTVAGSFGYMAPEFAYTSKVNEKVDVYSFGVVLLELVTGREANNSNENTNLADWCWRHYKSGIQISDAVDSEIKQLCHVDDMIAVFKLGLLCTSTVPKDRPSMKEVVYVLQRCGKGKERGGVRKVGTELDDAPLLVDLRTE